MQPSDNDGVLTAETSQTALTPPQLTGEELRAAILAQTVKLQEESLFIPEWGFTVIIREMHSPDRVKLIRATTLPDGTRDGDKYYPLLTIASCFDPATGKAIFSAADKDTLNSGGGTAMERVSQVASRLSGLDADMFREIKKV